MQSDQIHPEELIDCLKRSGYLLESRIVKELNEQGYFVEPSQVLRDPTTGKSREIDFLAENHRYVPEHSKTKVTTKFVGEVVNNRYPIVLLTPRPSTPNADFESYVKYGCSPPEAHQFGQLSIAELKAPPQTSLFSQYCAITRKKNEQKELMASHSDDLYGSLQKLVEFTELQVLQFEEWTNGEPIDGYWRLFFWHPVLVVGGQLFVVTNDENNEPVVCETASAFLEYNWHLGEERMTTVIEFIQVSALLERMKALDLIDMVLEESLFAQRSVRLGSGSE